MADIPDINPTTETVDNISKKPLAYIIGVLVIVLGIFIARSFNTDDSKNSDCKEQIAAERSAREKADQRADESQRQLVDFLLAEKQRKDIEAKYRDSVVRTSVGNKAKTIIKNSQR